MPIIIDPASSEVNRGSYCYMPYLLYSAFMADKLARNETYFIEDFTIAKNMDDLDDFAGTDQVLCALWSYPQIEACIAINLFAKEMGLNLQFFGYEPLINRLGLPLYKVSKEQIIKGMESYINYLVQGYFDHILLSDCDKHLSGLENGKVYPMFTSYGCPRGCKFCSASLNTNHNRYELDFQAVVRNLATISASGVDGIHFTDEDFFFNTDRAIRILERAYDINPNFQIIALGHVNTFHRFYEKIQHDPDIWNKMQILKLVEIGLETADTTRAKNALGKTGVANEDKLQAVAKNNLCKVLWLTMTFYPGDTVASINATGRFLREYGLEPAQLCPRIRTNGTEGGLGQFYQFYDGCVTQAELKHNGKILTMRPMRLWPSYVPYSFLLSKCILDRQILEARLEEYHYWCNTNKCAMMSEAVQQAVMQQEGTFQICDIRNLFQDNYITQTEVLVALATMARLGIIKGK